MATIFQSFYPPAAVPDSSHSGCNDVSTASSSSLLACDLFSEDLSSSSPSLTPLQDINRLLHDCDCYTPQAEGELSSLDVNMFDTSSDFCDLIWNQGVMGSLQEVEEFPYTSVECLTFARSPLTSSGPVSPAGFHSSLSPSSIQAYPSSPLSPSITEYLSPSPSSFTSYSSPSPPPIVSASRKRQRPQPTDGRVKKTSRGARKERKKEQNKTAAIRYRQKKKEEAEVVFEQQQQLEEKNQRLHRQVDGMMAEINYLKKLWQDVKRQQ